MTNSKIIKEISCKLIQKIFARKHEPINKIIDGNAKCKLEFYQNGKFSKKGMLSTSLLLDLTQNEPIKIEFELHFDKSIVDFRNISILPITIIQRYDYKNKTHARFIIADVQENKIKCLFIEYKIACVMSEIGINELLNVKRSSYYYVYVPLLLMAWSFERLIKCLLNIIVIDEKGDIKPIPYPLGVKGHNLELLIDSFLSILEKSKYSSIFASVQDEIEYIKKDKAFKLVVNALTKFALGARYYYLDVILYGTSRYMAPSNLWDNIENLMHMIQGKESPPAGSIQLEKEMKQLTIKPLKKFQEILVKIIDDIGRNKFGDFRNIDTSMPYLFNFNLNKFDDR